MRKFYCAVLSGSVMSSRLLCPWGFSSQEYWSGLPCPPPVDLPTPGIKSRSPTFQVDSLHLSHHGSPRILEWVAYPFSRGSFHEKALGNDKYVDYLNHGDGFKLNTLRSLLLLRVCQSLLCQTLFNPMDCTLLGSSVHEVFRQQCWSGLPFPSAGDLPDLGIKPASPVSPALADEFFTFELSEKP